MSAIWNSTVEAWMLALLILIFFGGIVFLVFKEAVGIMHSGETENLSGEETVWDKEAKKNRKALANARKPAFFENPSNGYREQAGGPLSWLWVLLLGPVYMLVKGLYAHAALLLLAAVGLFFVDPVAGFWIGFFIILLYAVNIKTLLRKNYLVKGWREVENVDGKWVPVDVNDKTVS